MSQSIRHRRVHSHRASRRLDCIVTAVALLILNAGCMGAPPVPVTRGDLAVALVNFEKALADHPPAEGRVADVNRAFDQASLAFFGGSYGEVIRQLAALRLTLESDKPAPADVVLAGALKVRIDPAVLVVGTKTPVRARVTHMFEPSVPAGDVKLTLRIRKGGTTAIERVLTVAGSSMTRVDMTVDLQTEAGDLSAGAYEVEVAAAGGAFVPAGRWFVVGKSLDAVRKENDARLDALTDTESLGGALAACRSRNGLLKDRPSEEALAEFLADPTTLVGEVDAEIRQLADGKNPYRRRSGDYWRTIQSGGTTLACRVFAPAETVGDEAHPLVVALHGAGGDENMFFDAYGRGVIRTLAQTHGFIVVTPSTYPLLLNPSLIDGVIETMAADYAIDRSRVYVLGHSLGGMATARIAALRRATLAGAACLAGGDFNAADGLPPTLVYGAEVDPLVNAGQLQRGAERAAAAGLPVEFRLLKNYGHTLMVGRVLPEVVEWLLPKRLDPAAKPRARRRATPVGSASQPAGK